MSYSLWKKKVNKTQQIKTEPVKKSGSVFWSIFYYIFLTLFLVSILAGSYFSYIFIFQDLPSPHKLKQKEFAVSTKIYDRNDTLLYEIYADENREPIPLKDVPIQLIQATIAIEDKDFYTHSGFAVKGIARAFYNNFISEDTIQGGSTITQQLIKTALLTPEKTYKRKIKEIVLSGFTELIYSKDEILEMYLNSISYGGTAYGIEQASKLYFGKSAKDLDLAQSALLAGLPQAPSNYSPFGAHPELATQRQRQVLQRMVEDGYITDAQRQAAESVQLTFAQQITNIKSPHFVYFVKDWLINKYGEKTVEQGGLRVKTTIDLGLQESLQASLSAQIDKLSSYQVGNGASVVTRPSTGEILAMIGSRDYWNDKVDGKVNLTTSLRQPGSSIKPLNFALGLYKGYTASTIFLDIATCFNVEGQKPYCPKNYDGNFHGPVQMRYALANSYNIPAVKMLALNGLEDFIATASAMGITTWKDRSQYGLSLTLGGGEVKMVDMATAFGVFANSGIRIDLNPILKVETYDGKVLEEHDHQLNPPAGKRILPPEVTFIMSHMLSDNNARTPAFGPSSKLVIPGKTVSVKTGTTDDLRDNWTIGYTPEYVVAVWVGNNDNSKMNPYLVSGITGAAPIWNDIMSYLLKNKEDVIPPKPENIVGTSVCLVQPTDGKPCEGRFEYYIKGTEKNQLFGGYRETEILIDKSTGQPAKPGQTDNVEMQKRKVATDIFTENHCYDCPQQGMNATIVDLSRIYKRLEQIAKNVKR